MQKTEIMSANILELTNLNHMVMTEIINLKTITRKL